MNRLRLLAYTAALAAIAGQPARAADVRAPVYGGPAPIYVAPDFSWDGFYAGINTGYGLGSSDWSSTATGGSIDAKGMLVGTTLGYNWQHGTLVFGAEGDFDATWINGTTTSGTGQCGGGIGCNTHDTWLATARARVGYAFDKLMPFVTGGGALGGVNMSPDGGGSEIGARLGWTAGAGLEYAYDRTWSVKLEYLYTDLGTTTCSGSTCGIETDVSFKGNIVRAGLNYRF